MYLICICFGMKLFRLNILFPNAFLRVTFTTTTVHLQLLIRFVLICWCWNNYLVFYLIPTRLARSTRIWKVELLSGQTKKSICVWGYMLKKICVGRIFFVSLFFYHYIFFYAKTILNTEAKSSQI